MKNKLQKLRWERNISQAQLSMLSGVSRSLISEIENNGLANPSVETSLRLAKAFGVLVEDIFTL